MTASPLLTIVTVTLNSATTLERTIQSVLSQSFTDYEYLVVDGGSTDGTLEILRRYEDRICWKSEPDNGLYDAMNKGVARAQGKWIHLLNSDDFYYTDDVLQRVIPQLDENRLNYADQLYGWADGSTDKKEIPLMTMRSLLFFQQCNHPATLYTKAQYELLGDYDQERSPICADYDMALRALERFKSNYIPVPMTVFTLKGISQKNFVRSILERMQISINYGQPRWVAYSLTAARLLLYGLRKTSLIPSKFYIEDLFRFKKQKS